MRVRFDAVRFVGVVMLLSSGPAVASPHAQPAKQAAEAILIVRGATAKEDTLTAADLAKLPHQSVKVRDQSGEENTYEGVSLADTLKRAGLDFDANLHGRALTKYLLAEAADKYRIVYALPEFDPSFTNRLILVATTKDGKPLTAEEGPLRIIVPDDKRPARWIRRLRMLTIVDAVPASERNKKP